MAYRRPIPDRSLTRSTHHRKDPDRMTSPSLRARLLSVLMPLILAAPHAHADGMRKPRPGVGPTPAISCLTTTITESGNTRMSRVMRSSGNKPRDNASLRFASRLKFTDPDGKRYTGGERQVTLLVRMHQNGRFAWRSFEADEELPEICSTPADTERA